MQDLGVFKILDQTALEAIRKESPTFALFCERQEKFCISALSQDLLAYVLSFCALADVKHIALVCKSWTMLLKKPIFWKRHFFARAKLESPDREWYKRFENIFGLMVPSQPPHTSQDLLSDFAKTNFSWIFSKRLPTFCRSEELVLYGNDGKSLMFWFNDNDTCFQYGSFCTYKTGEGRRCFVDGDKGHAYLYQECTPRAEETTNLKGYVVWDNGSLQWEGDSWDMNAFGAGTWTWKDGRKFSGKNVAFGGQPHGKGEDENGQPVEYIAGYKKEELEESFQRVKRRKMEPENKTILS